MNLPLNKNSIHNTVLNTIKIIQISDTHICKDTNNRILGLVNPEDTFLDVLQLVKTENPDLVIATGDLSQDGSIESYQRLSNYFKELSCDVYTIYGNHDDPDNFDKWLIGNNVRKVPVLETTIGNFIFLNSYKQGYDSGYIDNAELNHLIDKLTKYDDCIPVIHHHFVPLGTLIDTYIMENNQELLQVLKKYKSNIKFCVTGHVHNSYQSYVEDIPIYSSLSTCIQFAKTKELLFDNKRPGITIYNFYDDNNYEVIEKTI